MTSTVNGIPTAPDAHGIVQSNLGFFSTIAGDDGNNILQVNNTYLGGLSGGPRLGPIFYGGGGNDTFVLEASTLDTYHPYNDVDIPVEVVIWDFQGAGTCSKTSNDFIAFEGFGSAGWKLEFIRYGDTDGRPDHTLQYYKLVEPNGHEAIPSLLIHSLDGALLTPGDYAFYN